MLPRVQTNYIEYDDEAVEDFTQMPMEFWSLVSVCICGVLLTSAFLEWVVVCKEFGVSLLDPYLTCDSIEQFLLDKSPKT